jgi:diguanylate cyclase (GGDEF)-like protein
MVVGAVLVVAALVAIARDHRGLRRQATTDALTNLPNRAAFERSAATVLAKVERERTGACLLLVDLDRFKAVNDTLGHAGGDRVLIEAAGRLRRAVRDTDLVGRWGGDEFVILLAGIGDPLAVPDRAAAISASLAGIPTVDGGELTAAVGAAVAPLDGSDLPALLDAADRAMYAAKSAVAPFGVRSARLAR